ncbi:MAG TPA: hypothetical protein VIG97_02390 [Luteimonas sp.]
MKWAENLTELQATLSLYSSTSLPEAMTLSASDARRFCESKAFADWRSTREGESKLQAAIVDRLNGVIRSVGNLAKMLRRA